MATPLDTVDKLIDDAIEAYIYTACKDHGCSREDFNANYMKYELVEKLTEGLLEEIAPRGPFLG